MINQQNRPKTERESVALCERIFSIIRGRAQISIGGEMACYDPERKEVFIRSDHGATIWMPAKRLLENITTEEQFVLENLPDWDGSNEYTLNCTVNWTVYKAIRRYKKTPITSERDPESPDYFTDGPVFIETVKNNTVIRTGRAS